MESSTDVRKELEALNISAETDRIIPFKIFKGDVGLQTPYYLKTTPGLWKPVAVYEHKIFVQGFIWNIFSLISGC